MKLKTKKDIQKTMKNLKKSLKIIGDEWNKAMDELEKFNPMENMDFGMDEFENNMKGFNIDSKVKI